MLSIKLDNVKYEANALGAWLGTRSRGVFSAGGNLAVSAAGGMQISVAPGLAWLKKEEAEGIVCVEENAQSFTIAAASTQPRLDIVCVRLDKSLDRASVIIKKGTAAANPVIASPVRNEQYDEIYLASVLVPAGAGSVTAANISDLRLNKSYCGLVRDGVTMVPVDMLAEQIQALITEIKAELEQQPGSGGTVENLDKFYPVGSIYQSVSSVSPATLFGGTWVRLEDRFLIGAGSSYAAGSEGGAATHLHSTKALTLTLSQIPAHSHTYSYANYYMQDGSNSGYGAYSNVLGTLATTSTNSSGGGASHNHGNTGSTSSLPPYRAVYMWYRSA